MRLFSKAISCMIAGGALAALVLPANAQINYVFTPTTAADWNDDVNWSDPQGNMFVPSVAFDETAQINDAGSIAQVTDTPPTPIGLTIDAGAVEVASTGALTIVESVNVAGSGGATVNANGRLAVASGGAFSSVNLTVNGQLEMGSNAGVSATQSVTFNGGSVFRPQLSGSSFNPISTPNAITLQGGVISLDFSYTPSPSDTWDLFDGGSVVGNTPEVEVNSGLTLDPWQQFAVRTSSGGTNGVVGTLQLEDRIVLSINRANGVGTITNMSSSAIDLDAYVVESGLGSIGVSGFNSLSDQGADSGAWGEFGVLASTSIGELREEGITSLGPGASRAIGTIFDPTVTELGIDYEDLSFSYSNEEFDTIGGVVVYEGNKKFNNLVLNVNPDTGEATLVNESPLTIELDGYAVKSASGALLPGGWTSLEDQSAAGGDWLEIGSDSGQLGELKAGGSTVLSQGTSFDLGAIFDTSGEEDLTLEFFFSDVDAAPSMGVVSYELPSASIPGDYNNDGSVDAADYTVWRDGNSPDSSQAGYQLWRDNYGASSAPAGAATSAPEPAALLLSAIGALALVARRRS